MRGTNRRGRPDFQVEADFAAMQGVRRIVDRELIGFAVDRQFAPGDPIGVAPDQSAEVRPAGIGLIVRRASVAQHDIAELPAPVRDFDRRDSAAEIRDLDLCAMGIGQRVQRQRLAVAVCPKTCG